MPKIFVNTFFDFIIPYYFYFCVVLNFSQGCVDILVERT